MQRKSSEAAVAAPKEPSSTLALSEAAVVAGKDAFRALRKAGAGGRGVA